MLSGIIGYLLFVFFDPYPWIFLNGQLAPSLLLTVVTCLCKLGQLHLTSQYRRHHGLIVKSPETKVSVLRNKSERESFFEPVLALREAKGVSVPGLGRSSTIFTPCITVYWCTVCIFRKQSRSSSSQECFGI